MGFGRATKYVEDVAEELQRTGQSTLHKWADPKRYKRLLREDHNISATATRTDSGIVLTLIKPQEKKAKAKKGQMIQAFVPPRYDAASDALIKMLRRGPTFVSAKDSWVLDYLRQDSYTSKPYGNGVILRLEQ